MNDNNHIENNNDNNNRINDNKETWKNLEKTLKFFKGIRKILTIEWGKVKIGNFKVTRNHTSSERSVKYSL